MYFDFRAKQFVVDDRKSPTRNSLELDILLATLEAEPSFTLTDQHIAGTRTSGVIFTRTAGTWVASELVGKLVAAIVNTTPGTYTIHKVASNTTGALTIADNYGDAALITSADRIIIADTMQEMMTKVTIVAA